MSDDNTIILESKRSQRRTSSKTQDNLQLEAYSGHDWGERLSFTVGVSYMAGIFSFS